MVVGPKNVTDLMYSATLRSPGFLCTAGVRHRKEDFGRACPQEEISTLCS